MDLETAKQSALTQVGSGTVVQAMLDEEDGALRYEIDVLTDENQLVEIHVDASTGTAITD